MDRLVDMLVRLLSAAGALARVLPGVPYAQHRAGEPVKVLLVGYNGARNTGSDVRVAALADQLQQRMGSQVQLSVMSLDVGSTAPYFDAGVRQIPFGTLFFGKLYKACSEHHVAILCEGSTLKSKFANALTLYNCEAAGVMRAQGKPCIAYGSEVGAMDAFVAQAARDLCSDVEFVVRSKASLQELQRLGLNGQLGTDTAWTFDGARGSEEALGRLLQGGWDGQRPLLGIAPVDPFCWPVKPSVGRLLHSRVTGDWSHHYQAWYYFSTSPKRERQLQAYLESLAGACLTFAAERGLQPVIFGMERLDAQACRRLNELMGGDVPMLLSKECDGFVMTQALRALSVLATSRYHAQVLATGALVPTVAVSMDERLDNLAQELGTSPVQLLHVDDADLDARLLLGLDHAWDNRDAVRRQLAGARRKALSTLDGMGEWLADRLRELG